MSLVQIQNGGFEFHYFSKQQSRHSPSVLLLSSPSSSDSQEYILNITARFASFMHNSAGFMATIKKNDEDDFSAGSILRPAHFKCHRTRFSFVM